MTSKRERLEAAIPVAFELRDKTAQKLKLCEELILALTHDWAKEAGVTTIQFDRKKYTALKRAFAEAKAKGQDQFMFDGHTLLTSYAKYLIEYLGTQFDGR
jgi:hypothetical protein